METIEFEPLKENGSQKVCETDIEFSEVKVKNIGTLSFNDSYRDIQNSPYLWFPKKQDPKIVSIPQRSLRSFAFFIKECSVLCVLLRSL